jgi:hypothetical protein
MTRALTLLNDQGDVTISWSADRDEEMTQIISKKMAAGVTFFLIEPRLDPNGPLVRGKPLKKAADAKKYHSLLVRDEDLAKFVESGAGEAIKTPDARVKTVKRSKDPAEVARSESVGVRPNRGG